MTARARMTAAVLVVVIALVGVTSYLATSRPPADLAAARVAPDLGIDVTASPLTALPVTSTPAVAPSAANGGTIVVPVATVPGDRWVRPGELLVVRPGGSQPSTVFAAPVGTTDARRLSLSCERVHVAAGRLACFATGRIRVQDSGSQAILLDRAISGIPSRVRLSPDGRKVGVTVFEAGHSYQALGEFSTRAVIIDIATGDSVDVSRMRVEPGTLMGQVRDLVTWGVTFRDDDEFYVTVLDAQATAERRVPTLVRGSLSAGTLTPLAPWAECPSIAPDGTAVVFKERVEGRYRLVRYDLSTGERRVLSTSVSPDDQVLWADADTLLFTVVDGDALDGRRSTVVRLDLTPGAAPRTIASDASSPALS